MNAYQESRKKNSKWVTTHQLCSNFQLIDTVYSNYFVVSTTMKSIHTICHFENVIRNGLCLMKIYKNEENAYAEIFYKNQNYNVIKEH